MISSHITDAATKSILDQKLSVGPVQRMEKDESSDILRLRTELVGKLISERVKLATRGNFEKLRPEQQKRLIEGAMSQARSVARSISIRKFKTEPEREAYLREQIKRVDGRLK